jgi:cobalt-precorrin-5B (C1)-methyltransferase
MKKRPLRSGYTTGACAAAAAKAATQLLWARGRAPLQVDIPFPDGSRAAFKIHDSGFRPECKSAFASVIKDAGDDPDVTNGAEIVAEAKIVQNDASAEKRKSETNIAEPLTSELQGFSPSALITSALIIKGGKGVGTVTKPGLAVAAGEPAINPVPRKMIHDAVFEVIPGIAYSPSSLQHSQSSDLMIELTVSVTDGELLAKKTLNERLGIIGGLSILGTTGIVRPLSAEAWTATISSSMDVAVAMGRNEIVLSAGRTSERAHMRKYGFPDECYVMMGDYLEFSLREAASRRLSKVLLCAQWAKMLKIAMATPQTHVRHGAIDIAKTVEFLGAFGVPLADSDRFNTAREIFDYINANSADPVSELIKVCNAAQSYASDIADPVKISTILIAYDGEIICRSI